MKRAPFLNVLFPIILFSMFISSVAFAELPPHMTGMCMFTFKSSVPAAENLHAARVYLQSIKDKGYPCVIIKSHDGDNWGTKVNGKFMPAFSKHLVDAGHELNMRVYSYFTARLNHDSVIEESVILAERTLNMGADGVVIDDLALEGTGVDPAKWRKVFPLLRAMTDRHKGTILASSTHPHQSANGRFPTLWGIAFEHSDYFLPQAYWMEFLAYKDGKAVKMTPQDALAYAQSQFDIVKTRFPNARNCKLIPIGRTYGKNVTAEQVKTFVQTAMPFYEGAGLFVIEQEPPKGGWNAIKDAVTAFNKPGRTVKSISPYDQVNDPPETEIADSSPTPKKPATEKKGGTKKIDRPIRKQPDSSSRCGACP